MKREPEELQSALSDLLAAHALDARRAGPLEALLLALAREPDPPTTVREPAEALRLHVADSLSGLEVPALRNAARIGDMGAGAGFPGLALAAVLPQAEVDLIESQGRKCEVIARLAAAAELPNARPVRARVEEWALGEGAGRYDAVTARALAPLPVLVEYAAPLLRDGGVLVAWKGAPEEAERAAGDAAAELVGLSPAEIRKVTPFAGAEQLHLYLYSKVQPTPERFPRRPGMARKRPLA